MKNVFSKLLFVSFFLVGGSAVQAANMQPQRVVGFEGQGIEPSDPKRAELVALRQSILAEVSFVKEEKVVKPVAVLARLRTNLRKPFSNPVLKKTKTYKKGLNQLGANADKENN